MASERHVNAQLLSFVEGRLPPAEAEEVRGHLQSCRGCQGERDLLQQGVALFGPTAPVEPRVGFAVSVAMAAAEQQRRPFAAPVWRWAFGGMAGAALAAGAVLVLVPHKGDGVLPSHEMLLAQRLDFYEELSVVQNRDALENLDVVEELDQLPGVGKP